ncbi:hypothetical protein SAMN05428964_106140 [Thalassospira xiamenensis]|uniref:Uncharacterized protein n=1 Tax=Thalassospira xiamenensis TaxID=220697 RepID=A0A285TZT3_9PROT|nr:hypothetical protein SAMN05428964_106140 [Thalassospira xiamenensis]
MKKAETFRMAVSLVEKLIETKQIHFTTQDRIGKNLESQISDIHAAIRCAWDKAQDDGTSTTGR